MTPDANEEGEKSLAPKLTPLMVTRPAKVDATFAGLVCEISGAIIHVNVKPVLATELSV